MARIEPFAALRPRADIVAEVASPPYDVLSSAEARDMAGNNPSSFLHVVKPEIDLPEDTDIYAQQVYATGASNLRRLVADGILAADPTPAFYLYRQIMGDHAQIGLVAGASVDEYESGGIKKHEHTRPAKEDDRTRHVDALDAQTGPVFLTYRARPEIDRFIARLAEGEPTTDFVADDGVRHTLWVVDGQGEIEELKSAFAAVPALYVADGHHRSAAATRVRAARRESNPGHTGEEAYNCFLSVIFPHDQMLVMDYNRVVRDLADLEPRAFLARVGESFLVVESDEPSPSGPRCFGMYLGGRWYQIEARAGSYPADDPVARLGVAILQDNLLAPILGIGDPRLDDRIDFVGGIRGSAALVERVESGQAAVAFKLFPTSLDDLMAVADAGDVMPPKSTWFEPKLRSGLVVRKLSG